MCYCMTVADPSGIFLPGTELLQSPFRSAWDHVCGNIEDHCGAIADFCGVIADFCGVIADFCRVNADPCAVVAIPETIGGRALRDSLNIIKHC